MTKQHPWHGQRNLVPKNLVRESGNENLIYIKGEEIDNQ